MEQPTFPILLDRTLNSELLYWSICPTQDVIACCFADHVSCNRLHWQRLWNFQRQGRPTLPSSLVWHPEARSVGVGFDDGSVVLLDPESGELQHEARISEARITSLSWLEEEPTTSSKSYTYAHNRTQIFACSLDRSQALEQAASRGSS